MDGQDGQDRVLKHEAITKTVIGCAFEVKSDFSSILGIQNWNTAGLVATAKTIPQPSPILFILSIHVNRDTLGIRCG
ncbi:MAG: hypothetical protein WCI17_08575 [bacterium]